MKDRFNIYQNGKLIITEYPANSKEEAEFEVTCSHGGKITARRLIDLSDSVETPRRTAPLGVHW